METYLFEGNLYAETGDVRPPKFGEIILSVGDEPVVMRCLTYYPENEPRRILRRIKRSSGSQAQIAWNQRAEDG